jgi:predicted dehydrogenase
MSERMRLGIVGAGAIARAYAAAIRSGASARLAAVADVDRGAAEAMAGAAGATAFRSHADLAESGLCDAVVITTPPVTHAPIAIDLASQRLPILCEKPLSVDLGSAIRMTRAATENGVLLSMASKFRFVEDLIRAREMIDSGAIGRPLVLENTFTSVVDMRTRWNSDPKISGGGVLIDNGTHSVDIVRYMFGQITDVLAVPGPRIQEMAVEDSVTLMARTQDGKQATIETSWSLHKDRPYFIGIYGTDGAIEVGWKSSRIRRERSGAWETFGAGYDKVAAFERQIDCFVGVLKGENRALPDAHDALASVLVIQAAYRSMARRAWTPVDERPVPTEVSRAGQAR